MCSLCDQIILQRVRVGYVFRTLRGRAFTITDIRDGKIHLRTGSGGEKWFHIEHAGMCLHWMRVNKRVIDGVGSARHSIRGLVGANGILAQCGKCDRNPAYIWGILSALPLVKKRGNKLFIP